MPVGKTSGPQEGAGTEPPEAPAVPVPPDGALPAADDPGINASITSGRHRGTLADDLPEGDPGINAHITS
jgi:hypothetical protein